MLLSFIYFLWIHKLYIGFWFNVFELFIFTQIHLLLCFIIIITLHVICPHLENNSKQHNITTSVSLFASFSISNGIFSSMSCAAESAAEWVLFLRCSAAPTGTPAGHMTALGEPPDSPLLSSSRRCQSAVFSLSDGVCVSQLAVSYHHNRRTWRTQPETLHRCTPTSRSWRTGRTCSRSRPPHRRWGGGGGGGGGRPRGAVAGRAWCLQLTTDENLREGGQAGRRPLKPLNCEWGLVRGRVRVIHLCTVIVQLNVCNSDGGLQQPRRVKFTGSKTQRGACSSLSGDSHTGVRDAFRAGRSNKGNASKVQMC